MRYLSEQILKDLEEKMVFIAGPRQCGKTTLGLYLMEHFPGALYLNWDDIDHKVKIRNREWSDSTPLIFFDEIHKWSDWRNFLKGTYDTRNRFHKFLVAGSARLDLYRKGGDSMLGRYHLWRLHPFSLSETHPSISEEDIGHLMKAGGFPQPYLNKDVRNAKRWRRERYERVISSDLRDLTGISDIQKVTLLISLLRRRVRAEIVYNNLAQDIQVSPKTVKSWIESLAAMYVIFLVYPYSRNLPRAVQKSPKVYFYDTADVDGDVGAVLENQIACELLKLCHYQTDYSGDNIELFYVRDKEKREVDFLVTKDQIPVCLFEVKNQSTNPAQQLNYFGDRLEVKSKIQLVKSLKNEFTQFGIRFVSPEKFFTHLAWEYFSSL